LGGRGGGRERETNKLSILAELEHEEDLEVENG